MVILYIHLYRDKCSTSSWYVNNDWRHQLHKITWLNLSPKMLLIELGSFHILFCSYIMILKAPHLGQDIITCSMSLVTPQRLHLFIGFAFSISYLQVPILIILRTILSECSTSTCYVNNDWRHHVVLQFLVITWGPNN